MSFETVTILHQGEVEHRDSGGGGGKIGPGDVQWMTAASGVVHEEFHGREYAARGGEFGTRPVDFGQHLSCTRFSALRGLRRFAQFHLGRAQLPPGVRQRAGRCR